VRLEESLFCRATSACPDEFLQLVDDIVEADAGFGMQTFCHFLVSIVQEAMACLQTPLHIDLLQSSNAENVAMVADPAMQLDGCQADANGKADAGGASVLHNVSGSEGRALSDRPGGMRLGAGCCAELASAADNSRPFFVGKREPKLRGEGCDSDKGLRDSVGQEFLGWEPEQAVLNLASAADGLQSMLGLLDRVWCEESGSQAYMKDEQFARGLGAGLRLLSRLDAEGCMTGVGTCSCTYQGCDHDASMGRSKSASQESLHKRCEVWPWVRYSRQVLAQARLALRLPDTTCF
jgi:hypothetical protein